MLYFLLIDVTVTFLKHMLLIACDSYHTRMLSRHFCYYSCAHERGFSVEFHPTLLCLLSNPIIIDLLEFYVYMPASMHIYKPRSCPHPLLRFVAIVQPKSSRLHMHITSWPHCALMLYTHDPLWNHHPLYISAHKNILSIHAYSCSCQFAHLQIRIQAMCRSYIYIYVSVQPTYLCYVQDVCICVSPPVSC